MSKRPPPEEKTFTPVWGVRGEYNGYVVIRVKDTDTIINSSDSTFTVTDDNIVFEVKDDTGETVYKATADADNASDNNVDTESWTLNVKNIAHPNSSEQATTNATVVVKNNESGKPVMTIEFEAEDLNSLIYSFEYEKPEIEPTFAPDWAVGNYTTTKMGGMNAEITKDSFKINVMNNDIVYPAEDGSVSYEGNSNETDPGKSPWSLTLKGVKFSGNDVGAVKVIVENVKSNEELKITVELSGDFASFNGLLNEMTFTADNSSVATE